MKSTFFLIAALLLITASLRAQDQRNLGRFEFALGAAFPVGSFGKVGIESGRQVKGSAKAGQTLELAYHFSKKNELGFSLVVFGTRNPLNTAALEKEFTNQAFYRLSAGPSPNPPPGAARYYKNWTFSEASWYTAGLMAAGGGDFPINKNISIRSRIAIGGIAVWAPEVNGYAVTDTSYVIMTQFSDGGLGLAYSISTGLSYHLNPKTSLNLNVGYLGTSNIHFFDTKTITGIFSGTNPGNQAEESSITTKDVKQTINIINLSVGASFIF